MYANLLINHLPKLAHVGVDFVDGQLAGSYTIVRLGIVLIDEISAVLSHRSTTCDLDCGYGGDGNGGDGVSGGKRWS